ncbi:MAG: hypothetical protein L6R40_000339 [Gallowayella cf. fulva]|nr:MAG: hypothetical protein L6R40_000339 [Xanthomendoza cf. fulva]
MRFHDPDSLLTSLKGQKVFVKDLNVFFKDWPSKLNIHLDDLRVVVDAWLESTMAESPLLRALKAADFGLFGATWWPEADWERLKVVTLFATWLFCWDDQIDSDDGSLWDDFGGSQVVRDQTLSYVRSCLDISDSQSHDKPPSRIIGGFQTIGEAIRKGYTVGKLNLAVPEQRERFMKEFTTFVKMSQCEQSIRLSGKVPSIDEFWQYRLGTSAVYTCLAINEFSWGDMHLPPGIMEDENMKALWNRTNVIISTGDAQSAVDQAIGFLEESVLEFEETIRRLQEDPIASDAVSKRQLHSFIKGCEFYCSGNLAWSLSTGRYGINCEDMSRGVFVEL